MRPCFFLVSILAIVATSSVSAATLASKQVVAAALEGSNDGLPHRALKKKMMMTKKSMMMTKGKGCKSDALPENLPEETQDAIEFSEQPKQPQEKELLPTKTPLWLPTTVLEVLPQQ